jgi:hypothetical protein
MQEAGVMHKLREVYFTGHKVKMDNELRASFAPINIRHIFIGYFIAVALCYVILLVEIGVKWMFN